MKYASHNLRNFSLNSGDSASLPVKKPLVRAAGRMSQVLTGHECFCKWSSDLVPEAERIIEGYQVHFPRLLSSVYVNVPSVPSPNGLILHFIPT